jgi:hypothetical protein
MSIGLLLVLKLTLVPGLVLLASLATRRWGAKIGGLLTGLPIVSAPALFFFAVEQGDAFAAEASRGVIVSLLAVAATALSYAWVSLCTPWWLSLPVSWTSFFVVVWLLYGVRWPAAVALIVALASMVVAQALLPRAGGHTAKPRPAWDLPLRAFASMALVVVVTGLAHRLGPTLSGALTPFPVAISILLGFSHAQQGSSAAISFLRGFFPGMWGFAAFCFVLSVTIVPLGTAAAFALATACALLIQAVVLWGMRPRRADYAERSVPR